VLDKQQFTLQALDKTTGIPAWSFSDWRSSSRLGYCSSPVATGSMVFFGWGEGRIFGLSAETGEKLWEDSLHGHILSSPAIAMGKLFVATMDGQVYAYTLSNTPPGLDFDKSTYCYPNPARNGVSHIQVYVAAKAELGIIVYNSADKPVFRMSRTLAAGEKFAFDWDVMNVANGVYFAIVKVRYEDGKKGQKILKIAVLR
jgi:outer membrane protein assembly factor BamB